MDGEKSPSERALSLAVEKHNQGNLKDAEIIYRQILDEEPFNPDALHLLGLVAHQMGKYEDALIDISKAIEFRPNAAIYYGNLGMVYDSLGREEDSMNNFKKALELDPKFATAHLAHYNLGVSLGRKGMFEEALAHYNQAVVLDPNLFDACWNKSLILLSLDRYKEGWEDYESRFKKISPSDSRAFNKPQWDGSSIHGKKILVVLEQGAGDNINFIRYLSMVKKSGGYVILECSEDLKKLLEGFYGIDEFVIKKEDGNIPEIEFDYYAHLMSLPRIFNTEINTIPREIPYLKADAELSRKFKERLGDGGFKIGIVWAGNPMQDNDKNRSTSFEKFKPLQKIHGVQLFSLQKGEKSKELDDFGVIDLSEEIKDFADTAAIIENMDLIISVDTSVSHLAGAMGKQIWTLLTFVPDWRYCSNEKECLWYPGMRLYRQKKHGDWNSVFENVDRDLRSILELKS